MGGSAARFRKFTNVFMNPARSWLGIAAQKDPLRDGRARFGRRGRLSFCRITSRQRHRRRSVSIKDMPPAARTAPGQPSSPSLLRSTSVLPPFYLRSTSLAGSEVERRKGGGRTEVLWRSQGEAGAANRPEMRLGAPSGATHPPRAARCHRNSHNVVDFRPALQTGSRYVSAFMRSPT
jgi:hypothetical protein